MSATVCLIRITPPDGKQRCEFISTPRFKIGRSDEDVDIVFEGRGVSRVHLLVEIKHRDIQITDIGSSFGTTLNGQKVQPKSVWNYKPGDVVQLGAAEDEITFEVAYIKAPDVTEEAKYQANEILQAAQLAANEKVQKSVQEADDIIRSAQSKADEIKKDEQKKVELLRQQFQKEALDVKISAQNDANKIIIEAKSKAAELMTQGQGRADAIVEDARRSLPNLKKEIEDEASQLRKTLQESLVKQAEDAQAVASDVKAKAQQRAEAIIASAHKEADELVILGHKKADEILERAKTDAKLKLDSAMQTATSLIEEKQAEGEQILEQGRRKVSDLIKKSEHEIAEKQESADRKTKDLLNDAFAQSQQLIKDAEGRVDGIKDKAYQDGKAQAAKIIEDAKNSIVETEKSIATLKLDLRSLEQDKERQLSQKKTTQSQLDKIKEDIQRAENDLVLAKREFLNEKLNRDKAESEFRELKTHRENLSKEMSKMKEDLGRRLNEIAKADSDLKTIQQQVENETATLRSKAELEIKKLREKAQAAFVDRQKAEEADMLQKRLKHQEEIRNLWLEEERKIAEAKKHHKLKVSNDLELELVPLLKSALTESGQIPKKLFPLIHKVVSNAMDELPPISGKAESADSSIVTPRKKRSTQVAFIGMALLTVFSLSYGMREHLVQLASPVMPEPKREVASKPKFELPKTDKIYDSYTENILRAANYLELKTDPELKKKWTVELNKFLIEKLNIEEDKAVEFISIEADLMESLRALSESMEEGNQDGITKKMKDREDEVLPQMQEVLKSKSKYKKFRNFEKDYFSTQVNTTE